MKLVTKEILAQVPLKGKRVPTRTLGDSGRFLNKDRQKMTNRNVFAIPVELKPMAPIYTAQDFFDALERASRGLSMENDAVWNAIPKAYDDGGPFVKMAEEAFKERRERKKGKATNK